jgi:tetratricopeptide (TPR) repeat protein
MYERALQGFEKALGPEHISTLNTVNSLGSLYAYQARLNEAEAMYERAFQGYEKTLGQHEVQTYPPALKTLTNLALLMEELGKREEARMYYTRAAEGVEKVWGVQSQRYQRLVSQLQELGPDTV